MEAYLPAALLHLREAEIVQLCGLARAARGQEIARTRRVSQPQRAAGALRATVQDSETTQAVLAHFSDDGLDGWECSCSLPPGQAAAAPGMRGPCEHVAALLYCWVREPGEFRAADFAVDVPAPAVPAAALTSDSDPSDASSTIPALAMSAAASAPSPADLERLSQELRSFLNLLALAGGSVTEREAQRLFVRLELGEPEAAVPALERLQQRGWVQPVFAAAPDSGRAAAESPAGWSIPDEALAWLPRVLPLTPLPAAPPEGGLREQRAAMGLPALLVRVTAQMVDRSRARAPASPAEQQPAGRSTVALDAVLAQEWAQPLGTTPEQMRFCLALLRWLGVLPTPVSHMKEQAGETLLRAYRLLIARPEAEALRDLFAQWLHARSAGELVELRDAGVRVAWLSQRESKHRSDIAAENQAARQFIVNLLRWVPVGRWWSFSSLVEFVWRFQPAFLRGRQHTFLRPQWWLERLPEGQPLAMDVRMDWRQGEGRYIALLVRRALHWLGAVDLALDAEGRLKGFRVTPPGAFLLGAASDEGTVPQQHEGEPPAAFPFLQFQEDGTLLAPLAALQASRLETLLWWCEPAGATREALRFRPSAQRVAASLDAGRDLEAWLAWLEEHPQSAMCASLLAQLRGWAALYGQARVYESVTLLEVSDAALLRELEAALDLSGQFSDHALAPGLVVLRPGAAGRLVEELRRRGYAPWIANYEAPD